MTDSTATNGEDIPLEIHDLTAGYHKKPVLWGIDLKVPKGKLVGVVGPNGAGKSSLFKLLLGELAPDQGDVEMSGGQRIAHMAQEVDALDRPIIEYVLDGDVALRQAEADLLAAREAGEALVGGR